MGTILEILIIIGVTISVILGIPIGILAVFIIATINLIFSIIDYIIDKCKNKYTIYKC